MRLRKAYPENPCTLVLGSVNRMMVAHTILEQIMVSDFTKRQLSILLFILRLSWGCGKKEAIIPLQNDFEIVGVGKGHIKNELDWLIEAKVIARNENRYSFNKDYDQWRVSRAREYTRDKVTKMVTLNLNGGYQLDVHFRGTIIDWVIIGACTGRKVEIMELCQRDPELTPMPWGKIWTAQPPFEWVAEIVQAADKAGVKVFLKNNLQSLVFGDYVSGQ